MKSEKSVVKGIILANHFVTVMGIGSFMKYITKDANFFAKVGAGCIAYFIGEYVSKRTEELLNQIDEM